MGAGLHSPGNLPGTAVVMLADQELMLEDTPPRHHEDVKDEYPGATEAGASGLQRWTFGGALVLAATAVRQADREASAFRQDKNVKKQLL